MDTLLPAQSNTFYEALKKCPGLDLRDNRGKAHCIGLVLVGVLIGLYRNRDGAMSSIHRSMTNTHGQLCAHLGIEAGRPISRAQLPIVLKKVDLRFFSDLLFSFLGAKLSDGEKQWFAGDGKELRGSIATGQKRGEAVAHEDRAVYGQAFYNGQKESERPCIRQLLENGLCGQKISLDALHLVPETVGKIAGNGGTYLVGLKENQQELHGDMAELCQRARPVGELVEIEKSHGRIDKRTYKGYDIADEFFDQRWKEAGFQALVQVKRSSLQCRTNTESQEVALYISNAKIKNGQDHELFKAARGHWNVETNNHIRDVTFREDDLRTKEPAISRAMACCRTFALNLLNKLKPKNMKEKLEYFADNFKDLIEWMVKMKVL